MPKDSLRGSVPANLAREFSDTTCSKIECNAMARDRPNLLFPENKSFYLQLIELIKSMIL